MGTIHTSVISPPSSIKSTPLPLFSALDSKIAAMEEELGFYQQLLSWLLFSCEEPKRHLIEAFRAEVAGLRNTEFLTLVKGVEDLKKAVQNERGHPDLFSDVAHLRLYFNHIDSIFQSFKAKIYRRFTDVAHVQIW